MRYFKIRLTTVSRWNILTSTFDLLTSKVHHYVVLYKFNCYYERTDLVGVMSKDCKNTHKREYINKNR